MQIKWLRKKAVIGYYKNVTSCNLLLKIIFSAKKNAEKQLLKQFCNIFNELIFYRLNYFTKTTLFDKYYN